MREVGEEIADGKTTKTEMQRAASYETTCNVHGYVQYAYDWHSKLDQCPPISHGQVSSHAISQGKT